MLQNKRIGEVLIDTGIISRQELDHALEEQQKTGGKIGEILVRKGYMTEQQLSAALEFVLGIPYVQISQFKLDPETVRMLPTYYIRRYKVLPVTRKEHSLILAMVDPLNQKLLDDITAATGLSIIPVLSSEKEIDMAIQQYLALQVDPDLEQILGQLVAEDYEVSYQLPGGSIDEEAPIIRMVNFLLIRAVQGYCSDVHIEPQESCIRVRFRVDGKLYEVLNLPKTALNAMVSRLKIMANMDIAEKRLPQDGRFKMEVDQREVDFRVSTLPTAMGEKTAIRILDRGYALMQVDELGFSDKNQQRIKALARSPYGMLLVTGPTGSGKTTTLYALLNEINSIEKNIITLEDPIEYTIAGVNQVQINPKAGLNFATGLRSILRQDPDVIMVGEIRDLETAELAVQASLTGHLLFSTLHTNSAVGTLTRLRDIGIEGFLLAACLVGIISQRLVRRLCPACRKELFLSEEMAVKLGIPEYSQRLFFQPCGCSLCRQQGYRGRIALQEVMLPGHQLRQMIMQGYQSEDELMDMAVQEGLVSLKEDGLEKALQGLISLEELMKVLLLGG